MYLQWTDNETATLIGGARMAGCCASHANVAPLSLEVGRNLIVLLTVFLSCPGYASSSPDSSESFRSAAIAKGERE